MLSKILLYTGTINRSLKKGWKVLKIKAIFTSSLIAIGILSGCSGVTGVSTDEIITKVLAADQDEKAYYAKGELKIYEDDKLEESYTTEEYHSEDGKAKITMKDTKTGEEDVTVNDGKSIISFDKKQNKAMVMDDVSSLDLPNQSQKEQVISFLETLKDSHKYKLIGKEKVNGFETHHIKLEPKEKDSIFGEIEIWIDQKTWFPVKSINIVGSSRTEFAYTEVDTSTKISDDTFTLSLPDNVEIVHLKDEMNQSNGTIEEAVEKLGRPFLVLNEENLTMDNVTIDELKGEINRTEITITYNNGDGIPLIYLSVFPTPEEKELAISDTGLKIRGQNAEFMKEINSYTWDENGLRYTLIVEGPDSLSQEDIMKMTERMVSSSN